jgi:hypothetical protein
VHGGAASGTIEGVSFRIGRSRRPVAQAEGQWVVRHHSRRTGEPCLSWRRLSSGFVLREHRIGDFLIRADGSEVVCHPWPETPESHVEDTFLFPILPLVLSHRGVDGLHAAAVGVDDGAVALAGPSGAGKSTLAAAFVARGHPVLTDEYLIVVERAEGLAVRAGLPQMRLRPEGLAVLGRKPESRHLPWDAFGEKRVVALAPSPPGAERRLRRLYFLDPVTASPSEAAPSIERLAGTEAFLRFVDLSYRLDTADAAVLERQANLFGRLIAEDRVRWLRRPPGFAWLPATVERVLEDARSAA